MEYTWFIGKLIVGDSDPLIKNESTNKLCGDKIILNSDYVVLKQDLKYLEDNNLYNSVKDKIINAKDVKQVLNYVEMQDKTVIRLPQLQR